MRFRTPAIFKKALLTATFSSFVQATTGSPAASITGLLGNDLFSSILACGVNYALACPVFLVWSQIDPSKTYRDSVRVTALGMSGVYGTLYALAEVRPNNPNDDQEAEAQIRAALEHTGRAVGDAGAVLNRAMTPHSM